MLGQQRKRWNNITPTLGQRIVVDVYRHNFIFIDLLLSLKLLVILYTIKTPTQPISDLMLDQRRRR